MAYQAHNGYAAISDGRIGGNPLVFVEANNPCNGTIWYVPGTHADDPLYELAPAMASYDRAHRAHYWLGQYPAAAALPSYDDALRDPAKARVLFDASKGGGVRGITEDHRFALADVFAGRAA